MRLGVLLLMAFVMASGAQADGMVMSPSTRIGVMVATTASFPGKKRDEQPIGRAKSICQDLQHEGLAGWSLPTETQASEMDRSGYFAPLKAKLDAVWLSEVEETQFHGRQNARWKFHNSERSFSWDGAGWSVVCVTDGRTKAGPSTAVARQDLSEEVPKKEPLRLPGPLLTRVDPDKPSAEQIENTRKAAEADRLRKADEAAAVIAKQAEDAVNARVKEDAKRSSCMNPANRGLCACVAVYPPTGGSACGK